VTPLDVMVIVALGEAGAPGSGDVGAEELEPPEQAAAPRTRGARTARNLVKTTVT
jgi:hypothetical protein